MSVRHCRFTDFHQNVWHFEEWTDSQGTHYRITDSKGLVVAEAVDMNMSFQSWVQDLVKQAMDETYD